MARFQDRPPTKRLVLQHPVCLCQDLPDQLFPLLLEEFIQIGTRLTDRIQQGPKKLLAHTIKPLLSLHPRLLRNFLLVQGKIQCLSQLFRPFDISMDKPLGGLIPDQLHRQPQIVPLLAEVAGLIRLDPIEHQMERFFVQV